MKRFLFLFALIALIGLSACNRGVGCPSQFSFDSLFSLFSGLL